jgi:hypothetical protein
MVSAFAIENMPRFSGAFPFTPLSVDATCDVGANLIATDNFLFGRSKFFLTISHYRGPLHSVRVKIYVEMIA